VRVVVGLGANLGDRIATLRDAVLRLERVRGLVVLARSRVFETAPVGGPPQPAFLNAALLLDCTLAPKALLDELLVIERELGRIRGEGEVRFGPRTLDLDVLWIEGVVHDEPRLVVPHPRLVGRAFALRPMLDVAPEAKDPITGKAYVVGDDRGVMATTLEL
jgi:2-amino-4-hydroxy-6-hydroxymethyldihydropteridine diphosphokinase